MTELLFGTQLQKLRKEKGVTQEQIAEHMGVSAQAISKWENGSYPMVICFPGWRIILEFLLIISMDGKKRRFP